MSRRWRAADVRPMNEERVQFAHVARHLYQVRERWEQLVPELGDARGRAWAAGCAPAILEARHPDCEVASSTCRAHVLNDHDRLLAPAYRSEVSSAEAAGRFGRVSDDDRKWACVGDLGVLVIIRETGPERRPEVKTAYRIVPPHGAQLRPEDFFKAAVRKLRDKSSWEGGGL